VDLSLSILILGGGRGKRLGEVDKAFIRSAEGVPLWEKLMIGLSPVAREIFFVIRPEQGKRFSHSLAQVHLPDADLRLVYDEGLGPAQAVATAAGQASHECLLVLGVDHPVFDTKLVSDLCSQWSGRTDAVAARSQKPGSAPSRRLEPLWALYRRSAVLALADREDWSHRALRDLLDALRPNVIESGSRAFCSINELADLHTFDCALPVSSP
jgi:molybdopterin-guanine dinucleotide biosynthesis protein A